MLLCRVGISDIFPVYGLTITVDWFLMLIILSPAKSLDLSPVTDKPWTLPVFIADAKKLAMTLRAFSPADLASLMHISDELAHLNFERYQNWVAADCVPPAKQAILAFNGDVYAGLNSATLSSGDLDYAQLHVRILSGLYGILRPLDAICAYRLEMGTHLKNARGKDLYPFWGNRITESVNAQLKEKHGTKPVLVNLASAEYFRSIRPDALDNNVTIVTPIFEDWKNGHYKIISFYAKRARGLMARYAVTNRIKDPEQLKEFQDAGYAFDPEVSDGLKWIFRRSPGHSY